MRDYLKSLISALVAGDRSVVRGKAKVPADPIGNGRTADLRFRLSEFSRGYPEQNICSAPAHGEKCFRTHRHTPCFSQAVNSWPFQWPTKPTSFRRPVKACPLRTSRLWYVKAASTRFPSSISQTLHRRPPNEVQSPGCLPVPPAGRRLLPNQHTGRHRRLRIPCSWKPHWFLSPHHSPANNPRPYPHRRFY